MHRLLKLNEKFKQSLLLVTSLISTIIATPIQAITIASSEADFQLQNFSSNPLNVSTDTFTVAFAEASNGFALGDADADALFRIIEPFSISETRSFAAGEGNDFLGLADSRTEVVGNFLVDSDEVFSFDFNGFLEVSTTTESPENGEAIAAASLSFLLIDNSENSDNSLVSFFDVLAQVDTVGSNDILVSSQHGESISLDFFNSSTNTSPTENTEFITTEFAGSLNTSFDSPTSLTLVQINNSFALVRQTPESTSILSILALGVTSVAFSKNVKRKQK